MKTSRVVLSFSPDAIRKPVTYLLVSNYKLRLNILRAKVMPGEEGRLLLELSGDGDRITEGLEYLKKIYGAEITSSEEIIRGWKEAGTRD